MASILIIDDDVAVARLLGEALAKAGHAVKIATGGSAGLQYALRTRPEVIVCDVVMPGLDGWGVLRPDSEVQDIDAVAAALSWADGEFSFDSDEVLVEDRIGMGTTGLLMEAARRLDEAGR
ncbi:MAG: response regulator [Deltaproteobacteria bacterium]|nr:response regulator [Deltaproteobacteria bacterium]